MPAPAFLRSGLTSVVVVAALVACSGSTGSNASSTSPTEPDAGDAGAADAKAPPKDAETAKEAGEDAGKPPIGPTPTDEDCKLEADYAACNTCCAKFHVNGYATFESALRQCACDATTGPCKTACASTSCLGPGKQPDAACRTCLESAMGFGGGGGGGQCAGPVSTACQADADCLALYGCSSTCPGP